jgi:hypothetical protein
MSTNPYASPQSTNEPLTDSEREIRVVVRVFRWIGWLGTIIYVPMVVGPVGTLVYSILVEPQESPVVLVCAAFFNGIVLSIFVAMLFAASKLKHRRPGALKWGSVLSCVMMIGFPLFTLIGVLCLRKLRRYYATYSELPST